MASETTTASEGLLDRVAFPCLLSSPELIYLTPSAGNKPGQKKTTTMMKKHATAKAMAA